MWKPLYDKKSHNEFLVAVSQHRAQANSPGLGHGLYLKDGYFCFEISTTLYLECIFLDDIVRTYLYLYL